MGNYRKGADDAVSDLGSLHVFPQIPKKLVSSSPGDFKRSSPETLTHAFGSDRRRIDRVVQPPNAVVVP